MTAKNALITGASGTIGGSMAKLLFSVGSHVIINGSNQEKLQELRNNFKDNYTIAPCNLANIDECTNFVAILKK